MWELENYDRERPRIEAERLIDLLAAVQVATQNAGKKDAEQFRRELAQRAQGFGLGDIKGVRPKSFDELRALGIVVIEEPPKRKRHYKKAA